jgi:hypothetical protein
LNTRNTSRNGPLDRNVGHVADGDRDLLTTRLGAHPRHHLVRAFDALDGHTPGGQRHRDPAGPDRQLQYPPAAGQPREELNRRGRIGVSGLVVVVRPELTEERGIIEFRHGGHSSRIRASYANGFPGS